MLNYYKNIDSENKIDSAVFDILSNLDIKDHSRVFIKPNFSGRPPILKSENTSPKVIESVVRYLALKKCKIFIGHYALLALDDKIFSFDEMISLGGYRYLEQKYDNLQFINLADKKHKFVNVRNLRIRATDILSDMDYFINMPKAKTHMETQVSLSIKNLMGMIDGVARKNFHKFFLNELIGYLGVLFQPSINILDGLIAMEGNGPHEGANKKTNFIAAGDNLVELDSLVSYLMGFDYKKIVHINTARSLGVGDYPRDDIIKKYQDEIVSFKKASTCMRFGRKIFFWPTTSCSLCHEVMRGIKKRLKKDVILGFKFYFYSFFSSRKINIIIGRCENLPYMKDDINICIGVCTKWFADEHNLDFIPGCPPSPDKVLDYIFKKIKGL